MTSHFSLLSVSLINVVQFNAVLSISEIRRTCSSHLVHRPLFPQWRECDRATITLHFILFLTNSVPLSSTALFVVRPVDSGADPRLGPGRASRGGPFVLCVLFVTSAVLCVSLFCTCPVHKFELRPVVLSLKQPPRDAVPHNSAPPERNHPPWHTGNNSAHHRSATTSLRCNKAPPRSTGAPALPQPATELHRAPPAPFKTKQASKLYTPPFNSALNRTQVST